MQPYLVEYYNKFTISEEKPMDIGKRLMMLRKKNGYILKDMPDLLGVSEKTYWSYEKGAAIPSDIVVKLMGLFDVTADLLLTGKEPEDLAIVDITKLSAELIQQMRVVAHEACKEEFSGLLSQYGLKGVLE